MPGHLWLRLKGNHVASPMEVLRQRHAPEAVNIDA